VDRLLAPTGRPADRPTVRTALIPAANVETLDPTGCGDVFGAAAFARLLAGDSIEAALRHATALAARNAGFRGASGLVRHLRGELVTP
jgi:sugar/nucleoside kinase (ribokinase family)